MIMIVIIIFYVECTFILFTSAVKNRTSNLFVFLTEVCSTFNTNLVTPITKCSPTGLEQFDNLFSKQNFSLKVEKIIKVDNLYEESFETIHYIENAIKAIWRATSQPQFTDSFSLTPLNLPYTN